jgi:hypothetical protein
MERPFLGPPRLLAISTTRVAIFVTWKIWFGKSFPKKLAKLVKFTQVLNFFKTTRFSQIFCQKMKKIVGKKKLKKIQPLAK